MKKIFAIILTFVLSGCITTDALKSEKHANPILKVPFIAQESNECGPTVLAMAIKFYQPELSTPQLLAVLRQQTITPDRDGAFPQDMITSARRNNYRVIKIANFSQIGQNLKKNLPSILLLDVSWLWIPQWHYVIIIGKDEQTNSYYMHSDQKELVKLSSDSLKSQWAPGDNWGMTIIPN